MAKFGDRIKFYKRFFGFWLFPLLALCSPLFAQDFQSVTVVGMASMENVTKEEARRLAMDDGMRKAVEEVVGVNILAETLVINFQTSGDIIRAIPYGRVVEKEILEEGVDELKAGGKNGPSLMYRVKMKVKVAKEKGSRDPYFKLEATLNRDVFSENDEMVIKVQPQRDCYLNIFCILEDEKVFILLPNRYRGNNLIRANETFLFPDESDKKAGMNLRVHALPGERSTHESIYITCLKQPLSFDTAKFEEGIYGLYAGKTAFLNELIKEIIEVPLSERAERFLKY
jgi:Domain of unknown function (DUF4384)